jgi:hypothetical protein
VSLVVYEREKERLEVLDVATSGGRNLLIAQFWTTAKPPTDVHCVIVSVEDVPALITALKKQYTVASESTDG